MSPVKIAIVGYGKIARDQHAPSIAETDGLDLVATVSRRGDAPSGIPAFPDINALAQSGLAIDAVALCTPPEGRSDYARAAADHGWDILLEKPPGTDAAEVRDLADYVADSGQIVFTTWHAQYNAAVDAAAKRLGGQTVVAMQVDWREDVRKWHPGQDWIWEKGGFGVFDPGINGLSIATRIMPQPLIVRDADLVIAANHQSPIAARIGFGDRLSAHFDWRETGAECWTIMIETEQEQLRIDKGGSELWVDDRCLVAEPSREYRDIYARFADLIRTRESHVDIAPLALTEAAFRMGVRQPTAAFTS